MVPGTPSGWETLSRRLRVPQGEILAPAIHLAMPGFVVNRYLADFLRPSEAQLRAYENSVAASSDAPDAYPSEGCVLVRHDLGVTLARIAHGESTAYRGVFADRLPTYARMQGGYISSADLVAIRWRSA